MATMVDPRYFQFGNAFMGGMENAQENQRRDQLAGIEQQQADQQGQYYAQRQQEYLRGVQQEAQKKADLEKNQRRGMLASAAVAGNVEARKALYDDLNKEHPELGLHPDDPHAPDLDLALAAQFTDGKVYRPPGEITQQKLADGGTVTLQGGEMQGGAHYPNAPGQAPGGDRLAYAKAYINATPEVRKLMDQAARADPYEQGYNKQRGSEEAKRDSAFISTGVESADAMMVIKRGIELLDVVKTGGIDKAKLAITQAFGVTGADETELSSNLGKAVLAQLRATFGAQFTENEGARLASIESGFGKSTEGNRRLLNNALQITQRAAQRGLDAAKKSGDQFSVEQITNSMGQTLKQDSQADKFVVGKTYRDAKGNSAVYLGNGKWK